VLLRFDDNVEIAKQARRALTDALYICFQTLYRNPVDPLCFTFCLLCLYLLSSSWFVTFLILSAVFVPKCPLFISVLMFKSVPELLFSGDCLSCRYTWARLVECKIDRAVMLHGIQCTDRQTLRLWAALQLGNDVPVYYLILQLISSAMYARASYCRYSLPSLCNSSPSVKSRSHYLLFFLQLIF